MALVTLSEAKDHLRIDQDDEDLDIEAKLAQAEDIVLDYVGTVDPAWTYATAPARVKAAILLVVGHLHGFRGDDDKVPEGGPLSAGVRRVLERLREPALG